MIKFIRKISFHIGYIFLPLFYLLHQGKKTTIIAPNKTTRFKVRVNSFDKLAVHEVFKRGDYENEDFTVGRGDIVVDIGAHIGTFSIWAAQKIVPGSVYLYEPEPESFGLLKENIALNKVKNISAFNMAVAKKKGTLDLYTSNSFNMGHSLYEKSGSPVTVKTTTLADIFRQNKLSKIDYLKIDAEGAEYEIILPASEKLLRKISKITIEYHDYFENGHNYKEIVNKLEKCGFIVTLKQTFLVRVFFRVGLIRAHRQIRNYGMLE